MAGSRASCLLIVAVALLLIACRATESDEEPPRVVLTTPQAPLPQASGPATPVLATPDPLGPPSYYTPPSQPAARVEAEINVGNEPFYLAVGEGSVWVPDRLAGTLTRVDTGTGVIIATIPIGDPDRGGTFGTAASAAVGNGFVWVTKEDERAIAQVNPGTNTVVGSIPLSVTPHRLAMGADNTLWVTSREGGAEDGVLRVDLNTRRVVATIPTPVPGPIAVTDDAVWVGNVRADTVTRIGPRTNRVAAVIPLAGPGPHPMCSLCTNVVVVAGGAVWAGYTPGGVGSVMARIDPATNQVTAVIPVAGNPVNAAADEHGIWIAHFASETVTHIDPATSTVTGGSQVGYPMLGFALDGATAWATSHPHDRLLRLTLLP